MIFTRNHDRKMPVQPDRMVIVRMRCGAESVRPHAAKDFDWTHRRDGRGQPHQGDILEWRHA